MSEPYLSHYVNKRLKHKASEEGSKLKSIFATPQNPHKTKPPVMRKLTKESPKATVTPRPTVESQVSYLPTDLESLVA